MILAIDIGNTTVALGGIKDGRVCFVAHMDTVRTRTAEEYKAEMQRIFAHHSPKGAAGLPPRFEGAVLTSVVPQLTDQLAECARAFTHKQPVIVGPEICTGLTMDVPNPTRVGKDRIADAAAAAAYYPLPAVTVDLGTATTFNVVDEQKVFRGGVIAPGLSTGLRALSERCAQLPRVRLAVPQSAIGKDTESCMLSGAVMGTAALIDGMAERIEAELGRPVTLIITGGLSKYVAPLCRHPLHVDPQLLLRGLALLYELNAGQTAPAVPSCAERPAGQEPARSAAPRPRTEARRSSAGKKRRPRCKSKTRS